MRPVKINRFNETCPKCGAKVAYTTGNGRIIHGASESYEDWSYIKHNYCPNCGEKMERQAE